MGFNTRLVSPKDAPKRYEDLLNPLWKGHIAMDTGDARWYGYLANYWGREKTMDFCKKLAQQDIIFRTGKTNQATLLAAGEFKILVTTYLDTMEGLKKMGAPLDWVYLDPVIFNGHPLFVASTAPHQNAAKLYYNFLLSDKGLDILASFGKIPPRRTKNTDRILAEYYTGLKGRIVAPKIIITATGETSEAFARNTDEFRAIFLKKK